MIFNKINSLTINKNNDIYCNGVDRRLKIQRNKEIFSRHGYYLGSYITTVFFN